MTLFINVLLAWIAVISVVLLSIIWILRIIQRKMPKGQNKDLIIKINKLLRKKHIDLGYIFLITSLFHGMLSSFSLLSLNYGTVAFIIGILILLTFTQKYYLGKLWIKYHRQLTIMLFIATIVHVFEVGGFVGEQRLKDSIKSDLNILKSKGNINKDENNSKKLKYIDGEYEGIGNGYNDGLKVKVIILNEKISKIEIIEHNEVGQRFYGPAFENIPKEIIEKQETNVDVVSGSTYSSKGIIDAVNDALSKAIEK